MKTYLYQLSFKVLGVVVQYRSATVFLMVLATIVGMDILFHEFLYTYYVVSFQNFFDIKLISAAELDMGFSPEVWVALLSMVLSTLIIVISIASQSIPKLIDLYMKDYASLLCIWFLILSGLHAVFIKLYSEIGVVRESSRILNLHFFLSISLIIALPYIFYILKYTKPNNVINKIFTDLLGAISSFPSSVSQVLMRIPQIVEKYQMYLFESMNQLDDLLEYVSFKEPKADILQNISAALQEYVKVKHAISPLFFEVSPLIRSDISFKTMIGQFKEMERSRTFFEQKCFRLMGNIYIKLLEQGEFDLASLCVSEMCMVGVSAIEADDDELIEVLIIRLNTILRFAIKHGVKNNEARNLYNAAFHYGSFIEHLVVKKKKPQVQKSVSYLRMYGTEIFRHSRVSPAMTFIVDVFAAEIKKILILVYDQAWNLELQDTILSELLKIDSPPELNKEDLDKGTIINNRVRVLQIGLALFYLKNGVDQFVLRIIKDVLDDLEVLGEEVFERMITNVSNELKFSGPTFWEDTDRGNLNIYYAPYSSEIDEFNTRIRLQMETWLLNTFQRKYDLTKMESDLLEQLSLRSTELRISQIVEEVQTFEKSLHQLEKVDRETIPVIESLRKKLKFSSDNPNLKISSTRQIAVGAILMASDSVSNQEQMQGSEVEVKFNYPNYWYVQLLNPKINWKGSTEKITFHFKPKRQKYTYQFMTDVQTEPVESNLYKLVHTDTIKIIDEY